MEYTRKYKLLLYCEKHSPLCCGTGSEIDVPTDLLRRADEVSHAAELSPDNFRTLDILLVGRASLADEDLDGFELLLQVSSQYTLTTTDVLSFVRRSQHCPAAVSGSDSRGAL